MAVCNLERIIHILKASDYSCINKKKSFFFFFYCLTNTLKKRKNKYNITYLSSQLVEN